VAKLVRCSPCCLMNSTPSEEIRPRKSTYAILYSQAANVIASFAANRRRTKTARSCSIMGHRKTLVLVRANR
jgi:hypothetical protein